MKLARTEQKEAYAAEQIQQMEAYCETIAGAVKEETANKEEESVLCKKIKETEETAARAAEEAERLAGQDQVCEKLLDEKKNLEQKIHTLEETKKQLERTTAERTQIAAQVTQLRKEEENLQADIATTAEYLAERDGAALLQEKYHQKLETLENFCCISA